MRWTVSSTPRGACGNAGAASPAWGLPGALRAGSGAESPGATSWGAPRTGCCCAVRATGGVDGGVRRSTRVTGMKPRESTVDRAEMEWASRKARCRTDRGCGALHLGRRPRAGRLLDLPRSRLIHPPVDRRYLLYPLASLGVLKFQHLTARPVEVIRHECYLLVQLVEGVADHPPRRSGSTENWWAHFGQATLRPSLPYRLMRLYRSCR